jgi:predicted dehydrogenase
VYDRGIDLSQDPEGRREVLISYRSGDVLCPTIDKSEPILNLIQHFADCVERDVEPVSSGQQALRVVRVLEAADASLSKGGAYVEVAGV